MAKEPTKEELARSIRGINFKNIVTREAMPFAIECCGSPYRDEKYVRDILWGKSGNNHKNFAVLGDIFCYDVDSIAKNADTILGYAKTHPSALENLATRGKLLGTELDKFSLEIKKGDFSKVGTEKLISLFGEFYDKLSLFTVYLVVPLSIERYLQDTIKEGIKDIIDPKDDINSILIELTSPPEHDAVYKERVDLLKIAERYRAGKDVKADVARHIYDFGNVRIRWCMGEPWSPEELMGKIRAFKNPAMELAKMAAHDKKTDDDFKAFASKHKDRKALIKDIKVAKWYVWLRTYRTEVLSGAIVNIYPLLSEIGKRWGYTLQEMKYFTPLEILEGAKLGKQEFAKRKEAFAYMIIDGKKRIFSGSSARYFIDEWNSRHTVSSEVKGTVASRTVDTISGVARIVKKVSDLPKVLEGDILVAPMTEPNFVPAMERAAAFLTDEGGILCHAAIVSREMNKPCIIGTGNATKAIMNGEMITMDLTTGIVTKGKSPKPQTKKAELTQNPALKGKQVASEPIPQEMIETSIETDLVVPFEHIKKEHIHIAGGKGANLGEMSRKFPIPSGFCVTVNSYKMFLKEGNLERKMMDILKKLDVKDTKALDVSSERIRKLILAAPIPKEVSEQVLEGYKKLKGEYVAVRSSATAEDMPGASFAGQQDTYLNIKGEKALLDAVRRCWASLFTSRAIYYRNLNKFEHEKVHISVVVQNMIDAEKSGIMFSANPVTRNLDEIIIEGSYGLGEAIVSGQVTPDSYIVDKKSRKSKDIRINTKRIAIIRNKSGNNERITLAADKANSRCLTDDEIMRLVDLAIGIELHYGKPQDMEWAIYKGKVFILQSRPITTL
ncbi:MAG TPA: PEP/pyruvate-binding domain-containing protein [Candidatus Acidoferrales bacterium]|nr:PEP/pyruvate-binding domain-containing protein [Candidatus Acidoferrales bacterium]